MPDSRTESLTELVPSLLSLSDKLQILEHNYVRQTWAYTLRAFEQFSSAGYLGTERTKSKVDELPPVHFWRLMSAPETSYRARYATASHPSSFLDYFADSVEAELSLMGKPSFRVTWTSRGDRCADSLQLHLAPQMFGSITLDWCSPYASAQFSPHLGEFVQYPNEELALALSNVEAAGDLLVRDFPLGVAFLKRHCRHIVLRKYSEGNSGLSAFSLDRYPGRVIVLDPHVTGWTPAVLADQLIHETIHAILYMFESWTPFMYENPDDNQVFTSPVTGSCLDAHSVIHACFVYATLSQCWSSIKHDWSDSRISECKRFLQAATEVNTLRWLERAGMQPDVTDALNLLANHVERL